MKRWVASLFTLAIAITLLSLGYLHAQDEPDPADSESNCLSLTNRVGKLEEKVSVLTRQVADLRTRPAARDRDDRQVEEYHTTLKIFTIENADAQALAEIVENLFQRRTREGKTLRVASDPRTNSIIVRAQQEQLKEIEAVLQRLDEPEDKPFTEVEEAADEVIEAEGPTNDTFGTSPKNE